MQCVNCQFENMPGAGSCFRCGTSLGLATAAISINPPRAGKWRKELRRWIPLRQTYYPVRNAIFTAYHAMAGAVARDVAIHVPAPGGLLRMIVPGWAHAYEGHKVRGRVFTCAWLSTLLVGLLCYGSQVGAVAIGLVFAAHASSILDLLLHNNQRNSRTVAIAVALSMILALVIYWPIASALRQFIASRQLLQTAAPFVPGDVILYNPRAFVGTAPQPGDIILYRNRDFMLPSTDRRLGGRAAINQIRGEWVDRVVAGPNSLVHWEDGKLWVNGKLSEYLPFNPTTLPRKLDFQVPANSLGVLPSTDPYLGQASFNTWESNCVVANSMVVGKVFLRNYPFWRWWWVR